MKRNFLPIVLLLLTQCLAQLSYGQNTQLMNYGATWKYYDLGTNPGSNWTGSSFNDSTWQSGAGFLGYGDPWIVTCLHSGCSASAQCTPTCGTKFITTWFRKTLNITNVSAFDSVRFNAKRDDGIIVYVNGTEVWRDNMPATTVYDTTWSSTTIDGVAETTAVTKVLPISYFVNGNNTIAVELHQRGPTSSDITWDMEAIGIHNIPVPVSLTRGPYLQVGGQTAVNVRWRTNLLSKSRVEVGTVLGTYPTVVNDSVKTTEHEIRVTGLTPDTKYYYRFGTDTSYLQGDSSNFFVTAPADTATRKITIAAFGDCGRNDNNFQSGTLSAYQNYLSSIGRKTSDVFLLLGDNAYNAGLDAEFQSNFFNVYSSNILKNHMLFPSPGNHDYANDAGRQADHNVPYYSIFSMPSNGESGGVASTKKGYYSFNWGNIHFLSLDSYGEENSGTTRMYDTLGEQVLWIKNDLAANTKKWVIAYWHHPPYTMGSHNSDNETELVNIRQNFIRILERYGVDLIICGHSHDYERSYLLKGYYGNEASFNITAHTADSSSGKYNGSVNSCPYTTPSGKVNHGTVYVVAGSAGADGGVQAGYPHNALPFSQDDGGMLYLEVEKNRLDAKFIRRDNVIADQFTIMKDVNRKDTITVIQNQPVSVAASWLGAYAWNNNTNTRSITVTPATDTVLTVKDSTGNTCLTDNFVIHVIPDTTGNSHTSAGNTKASLDGAGIHPVPANNVLQLEYDATVAAEYSYRIYDIQGRQLLSGSKISGTGRQQINIDVRSLPVQQVLLLKVTAEGKEKVFRFTRQ
ncbi:metallophosphoesterase [Chitinophagaceae bacterium MMS25-I14]